jgi:arylsulfatase A-like enzyme
MLLVGWLAACPLGCARESHAPNVVVILADTLRADHLGHQGYPRDTSPRLDALARESVVFTRHTAHASRTGPSVATVMTGLHQRSHGVVNPLTHFDAKGTLGADQTTLAEILSQNGYTCAGFTANTNVGERFGFAQGFSHYELLRWKNAAEINRAALAWLDGWSEATPLCLYVHYVDPHSPYEAPARIAKEFVDPAYRGRFDGNHRQLDKAVAGAIDANEADIAQLRALYDAEIRYLDEELAVLLDALERKGMLEDAIVVFLSDHGEEIHDHGSMLHGYTLYEEQLRIPLLIRAPGLAPRTIDRLSRQIDVLPTLLELLEIEPPPHLQGESLVPWMRGQSGSGASPPVFAEASLRAVKTVQLRSYTEGDWKLIQTLVPETRLQLFHLKDDPGETLDRSKDEPERAARMLRSMNALRESLPVGRGETVQLTDEEAAELRALGYLPE